MAGICKQCGGKTTDTRAKSVLGVCFSCEHGIPKTQSQPEDRVYEMDEAEIRASYDRGDLGWSEAIELVLLARQTKYGY